VSLFSNNLNILIITDHYKRTSQTGGGEVIAQTLIDGLFSKGYKLLLFCCKGKKYKTVNESYVKRVFTSIDELKELNPTKLFFELLKEQIKFSRLINKFKPDLIFFLQNGRISTPTFSLLNNLPIPKIFRIGGMWYRLVDPQSERCPWVSYWNNSSNTIIKCIIKFSKYLKKDIVNFYEFNQINPDRIIVNSNDLYKRVSDILNTRVKIEVIKNGTDTNKFKFTPHILNKPVRLLYVGGLRENKGVDILVDTLDYIKIQFPDLKIFLNIVGWTGNNKIVNKLTKMIHDKGLENIVNLMGYIEHEKLPSIYNEHDIFVFPTSNKRIEGCPSAILEAMACGLPVVANLGPGTSELLKDNETCIEAKDDPRELGDAIMKLVNDESLCQKISNNAIGIINSNHTTDKMIISIDNLIKELIV